MFYGLECSLREFLPLTLMSLLPYSESNVANDEVDDLMRMLSVISRSLLKDTQLKAITHSSVVPSILGSTHTAVRF